MNTTATELSDWAHRRMDELAELPRYGSRKALINDLADRSGLSFGGIYKFYTGERPNLSVKTLDKLLAAIRQVQLDTAA